MLLAQDIQLPDGKTITGPLPAGRFTTLASVVGNALDYIFPIAGILLLLYMVWGGFSYITSMGDPKKAESARARITHAVIGFVIIFMAYWLVQILDYVFKLGVYRKFGGP